MFQDIYNCDCIEGMKLLPEKSIDLILSDFPYNITDADYDKSTSINLPKFWQETKRILKDNATTVLFGSSKFTFKLAASNFEQFKYKIVWLKNVPTNFANAKNMPLHKHEDILIFSKGSICHKSKSKYRMTYNPQGLVPSNRINSGKKGVNVYHSATLSGKVKREFENYPTDIWTFDGVFNGDRLHPAQKPVRLMEELILTFSNEGETVLDCCLGSGTTAIAALNTNRNFIGFEIDEKYFNTAQKRLQVAKSGSDLFL